MFFGFFTSAVIVEGGFEPTDDVDGVFLVVSGAGAGGIGGGALEVGEHFGSVCFGLVGDVGIVDGSAA